MKPTCLTLLALLTVALAFQPVGATAQNAPQAAASPDPSTVPDVSAAPDPTPPPAAPVVPGSDKKSKRTSGNQRESDIVRIGKPVHVAAGENVRSVVVVQSSATIDGQVDHDLVVIGGKARINGTVRGNVVNVGGGIVLGPDAQIRGDAVGVLGGIRMGANSVIQGDACGIVGGVEKGPGAQIHGETIDQHIDLPFGKWTGQDGFQLPHWIEVTLKEIVLKFRPLSFRVGWVWVVAGIFLALHLLLTLVAPGMVRSISSTLADRGATAFLMGFLALPLGALVTLILAATGIGLVVVPFFGAAFLFAAFAGKSGLLHFLGMSVARRPGRDLTGLAAVAIGTAVVTVVYLVPFLGMVSWAVLSMWAIGAGMLALLSRFQNEARPTPLRPIPASTPGPAPTSPAPTLSPLAMMVVTPSYAPPSPDSSPESTSSIDSEETNPEALETDAGTGTRPSAAADATPAGNPPPPPPPFPAPSMPPDALTMPRVALKERLLASLLDGFLLALLFLTMDVSGIRWKVLIAIAYFTSFWLWRQTTLGGIVLRLKVVRLDGRPMDAATALVRSLGATFGVLALGLGYFWSAWDPDSQGWHDKIAGTVVVRTPKSLPLV